MTHDYLVWGTVDTMVSAYKMIDEKGDIVPDVESQIIVKRMLTALIRFFADNELLKVKPFDADGKLIDRQYFRSEFVDEGIALIKRKESAWLDSKASKKNPPDMKILEKALAEIRTGK